MNLTTASMGLEDDQANTRNIKLNEFAIRGEVFHINNNDWVQVQF